MYQLMRVKLDVRHALDKLSKLEGERDLLQKQLAEASERKAEAEKSLGLYDLVQILLQKTGDYARQRAKLRIEELVTNALSVVFGAEASYVFYIELDVRAGMPIAEYWLKSGEVHTQLKPPDYDRGGGVADVVSLALRLAIGELVGIVGPLFLDEVGKHVSAEYAPNVAYFLREYSRRSGRQIILITHNQALSEIGDICLDVIQKNGVSSVRSSGSRLSNITES